MKKEYIFENDWNRGSILRETGGYYDYNDRGKNIYKISDKATIKELKKIEKLGDDFDGWQYHVLYLGMSMGG